MLIIGLGIIFLTLTFTIEAVSAQENVEILAGHTAQVTSVAFSLDNRLLASASADRTIRLWYANTGAHLRTLRGHTNSVNSVAFSPDGSILTSGSDDQTIRLWSTSTGKHLRTLRGHTGQVTSVAFSLDDSTLASGSTDGTIRLWSTSNWTTQKTLIGHAGWITGVAFSGDSSTLASASTDETIRLWAVNTGIHRKTIIGHANFVWSVSFSGDGRLLASGSFDNLIRLWDAETGEHEKPLVGHTGLVLDVAFSGNGGLLASCGSDRTIRLWDGVTGDHHDTLTGHTDIVYSIALNNDGSLLASGSFDRTVRLWKLTPFTHTGTDVQPDLVVESVTADKTTLAPGETFTLTATLKNIEAGRADAPIYYRWHRSNQPDIHKMMGSDRVLTGAREEIGEKRTAVTVVKLSSGPEQYKDVALTANQFSKQSIGLTAPEEPGTYYYSVCVESSHPESNPNNNCSNDVEITVEDDHGNTWADATPLPLYESLPGVIETASDVDYFKVEVPSKGTLTLYTTGDIDTFGKLERNTDNEPTVDNNSGEDSNFHIHHDVIPQTYYVRVTGSNNSTGNYTIHAKFRNTVPSICTFVGDKKVRRVAYSPDGTVLAAGDENNYFHFWNASTGEHLHTHAADGNIYGMAFSPRGRWFAIGTDGGKLWLWERDQSTYSTWLEMLKSEDNSSRPTHPTITVPRPSSLPFTGHSNDITSIAFSHDEERLAIGTGRDDVFVSEYDSVTGTWDDWDDDTLLLPIERKEDCKVTRKEDCKEIRESIVRSVAFHPIDSNILASGYEDGRVRIWDLSGGLSNYKENGPAPQVLSGDEDAPVYSIAFSPNGDYLATAGMFKKPIGSGHPGGGSTNTGHKIALWKRQNNQWVNHTYFFTDDRHDTDVLSVAFDPCRNVLLSGDKNGNIHEWGVPLGNHLGWINDYGSSNIYSIAFNSQGNAVAIGMDHGEVRQFSFDVSNQALIQTNVTINHRPKIHVIWYHASNEKLRGPEAPIRKQFGTNYISPDNVQKNLEDVQDFFQQELGTTFEFALDNNGIKVEYIQSRNFFAPDEDVRGSSKDNLNNPYTPNNPAHFKNNVGSSNEFLQKAWDDIKTNHPNSVSSYDTSNDIYLVLVQSPHGYLGDTRSRGKVDEIGGRIAMVPLGPFSARWNNEYIKTVIAHELGHNFGLWHDFAEEGPIMSYNWEEAGFTRHDSLDSNWLSERSKNWLKVHPAFNKGFSSAADNPIKIEVRDASQPAQALTRLSPGPPTTIGCGTIDAGFNIPFITVSPNSDDEYKVHLGIEDLDGLHHVELIAPSLKSYKGCDGGCGSKNSVAEWRSSNKPRTSASTEFDITEWMEENEYPKGFYTKIAAIDDEGNILYFDLHIVPDPSVAPAPLAQKHLPKETALLVNYPNPFNPETWIPYQLAQSADVTLTIYDINGHVVRALDLGHQRAGMYQSRARAAHWDGRNAQGEPAASGIYFYTLKAGDFSVTRKMLIRK